MPLLPFAGHEFRVAGGRALYWPARRALIVADLHLEKASWFAARGQMLPPHDSLATLETLAALVTQTEARELWCLGDNFHDSNGAERMAAPARTMLDGMIAALDWHWIIGNHDPDLPHGMGGAIHDEAEVDGLLLRHIAEPLEQRPELSGHFHPKHRSSARGRSVTRPCFVESAAKLVLPSFGAFTGGMDARDPAIAARTGPLRAIHVAAGNRLASFPA
jgi:DNA ligase-associated metallophosphoesterase